MRSRKKTRSSRGARQLGFAAVAFSHLPALQSHKMAPMDSSNPALDEVLDLYPPELSISHSGWQPLHMDDPPVAPPQDTREAELAALAAQEKLGHDGKRQRVRPRRTVDPFGGLERWKIVSLARRMLRVGANWVDWWCSSGQWQLQYMMNCS
jgi:hypothetical protein